jgi:signal transduction histidine kinase
VQAGEDQKITTGTAPDALRRRHRLQWFALAAGLLAILALMAADLLGQRERWRQEQQERMQQQLRLLEQAVARQFAAIDQALTGVAQDLSAWTLPGDAAGLDRRLAALDAAVTGTRTIGVADASGRMVASSRPELVGLDVSERGYFIAARQADDAGRLHVSEPFRTALGVHSLNLSRVLRAPDGAFAGVVTATLDPQWLADMLGAVTFAPDMWAAVAHAGGRLLKMVPAPTGAVEGADLALPGSMFLRHREAGQAETAFTGRITLTSQDDRLIVQRTLQMTDPPLHGTVVLALSRDLGAIDARWHRQASNAALLMAALVTLAVAGLAGVHRGDRRAAVGRIELERTEQRWALALEGAGLGVWDWDPRAGTCYCTPRARGVVGIDEGQAAGDTMKAFVARVCAEDRDVLAAALDDLAAGRRDAVDSRHRVAGAGGAVRWVHIHARVVAHDAAGAAARVIGTVSDNSAEREAEALRAERDLARAASQAKTEFLSRMSHELRTPLNAVLGFAQILGARAGQIDADEQRRFLRHIEDGGRHLMALVDDVLDLSRIQSGTLDLQRETVPLAPLLARVVDAMTTEARARSVTLQLDAVPAGAAVRADPARLEQVFTDLLGNAVKYNRDGGTARVAVARDDGRWSATVTDTGIGIPADRMSQLFEPFNRLGHTNSAIEGSGLGLVLTRWFVERMGGRLSIASREGEGTTVTVEMPAAAAS